MVTTYREHRSAEPAYSNRSGRVQHPIRCLPTPNSVNRESTHRDTRREKLNYALQQCRQRNPNIIKHVGSCLTLNNLNLNARLRDLTTSICATRQKQLHLITLTSLGGLLEPIITHHQRTGMPYLAEIMPS